MKINTLTIIFDQGEMIYQQLYNYIKDGIDSGRYSPGDKLPSSRRLAIDLGISRTSVMNAYNELISIGYITSQMGSGHKVNSITGLDSVDEKKGGEVKGKSKNEQYAPFNMEPMDMSFFPTNKMAKIISKIGRDKPLSLIYTGQYDKFGNRELRHEICAYVHEKKGINCSPEQVVITSGSLESFEMCINILSEPGQTVSLEDPCFATHFNYLNKNSRKMNFLQIDNEGACCNDIQKDSKVVFITPECQYPYGMIMSHQRKNEFTQWVSKNVGWLIEDDYDSNSITDIRREPTLFSLDETKRTLYIGNFSRVIEHTLHIGYIILPEKLVDSFTNFEYIPKVSYLPQIILAEFIKSGDFYRNLLKARKICAEKRKFFIRLLNKYLYMYGYPSEDRAGSAVTFILNPAIPDSVIASSAKLKGLEIKTLSSLCHDVIHNGFHLGFIYFNRDVLKMSVIVLRDICTTYCKENNIDIMSYNF